MKKEDILILACLLEYYIVFQEGYEKIHPPVLENWFLASVANEFERTIAIHDPPKYLNELIDHYKVDLSTIAPDQREHLQMHCSAQKVMQSDRSMVDRLVKDKGLSSTW